MLPAVVGYITNRWIFYGSIQRNNNHPQGVGIFYYQRIAHCLQRAIHIYMPERSKITPAGEKLPDLTVKLFLRIALSPSVFTM